MIPGLEHRRITVGDGTEIAYQVRGSGPAIVLANGLGGTYEAFRHVYAALGDDYRTICWDYRGLYRSGTPVDRGRLTVADQGRDLIEILEHEQIDSAVFAGWSMGVQVNFELYRDHPDRFDGIIAINGTYGRPFDTALSSRFVRYVVPVILRTMKRQHQLVGRATRTVVAWEGLVDMAVRFGMVSKTLDREAFRAVAEGFKDVDWVNYSDLLDRLGEHDASGVLPRISVPTLIITGDRDILTPPFTAEKMHRAIPGSRMVMIEGGTHYTPVEFPDIIKDEVLDFLSGISGYEPAGRSDQRADDARG